MELGNQRKKYVILVLIIFATVTMGKLLFYSSIGHFIKGLWGN